MRKLLFTITCTLCTSALFAQPWVDGKTSNGPVNLEKIKTAYERSATVGMDDDDEQENALAVPEKEELSFQQVGVVLEKTYRCRRQYGISAACSKRMV